MGKSIEIEALDTLIAAVNEYQVELMTNYKILMNAANVCDQAMGSDEIAKMHISNLNNALTKLKRTSEVVVEVAVQLKQEKMAALELLNQKGGKV